VAFESGPENHRQLRQWVADRLRSDILEGRLKPGEWLRQERLAQEHGVSQTPVREALKQLAAEGLVEHVPYRGIQVVQFSVEDVEDLYSCRAAVEGMAARYAAEAITGPELDEMRALHVRMVACVTPTELPEYRELNRRFHEAVSAASHRSYLMRTLAQLWAAFPTMLWSNIPRIAVTSVPGRDEPDAAEHAEIVAALAAHDPERAERAVRAHIESAGQTLAAAMRVQP
jgi:GntR family transcriptional regulator, rspAB operon transcriptional repressor